MLPLILRKGLVWTVSHTLTQMAGHVSGRSDPYLTCEEQLGRWAAQRQAQGSLLDRDLTPCAYLKVPGMRTWWPWVAVGAHGSLGSIFYSSDQFLSYPL